MPTDRIGEGQAPGRQPGGGDRAFRLIGRVFADWLYKSVDVHRVEPEPTGPTLLLLNHGGGFADPVVIVAATGRMPRFVARDVIWRVPVANRVMDAVQAIPIHRRQDTWNSGVDNSSSFDAVTQALADAQLVAIFPEGESIDAPVVHRLRTGAARLAVTAHRAGVRGVRIVPVGLHFRDKGALRSEVLVRFGPSLDLDELLVRLGGTDTSTEDDHALVTGLTDAFATSLRKVAPDFRDWDQARDLELAAAIALRSAEERGDGHLSLATYGNAARLADLLEDASVELVTEVVRALRTYEDDLAALGLIDADVAGGAPLRGSLTRRAAETALLAPVALAALPANAPGFLGTWLLGRLPIAPPTMATVKPMGALVLFPAGWVRFTLRGRGHGPAHVMLRGVAAPAGLAASLVVADRAAALVRASRAAVATRRRPVAQVRSDRAALVAAVETAALHAWRERHPIGSAPSVTSGRTTPG